jgi:hypothetical protein
VGVGVYSVSGSEVSGVIIVAVLLVWVVMLDAVGSGPVNYIAVSIHPRLLRWKLVWLGLAKREDRPLKFASTIERRRTLESLLFVHA